MKAIRNRKRLMHNKRRYKHLLKYYHNSMIESGTEIEFLLRTIRLLTTDKEKIYKAELAVYDEMVKEKYWDKTVLIGHLYDSSRRINNEMDK